MMRILLLLTLMAVPAFASEESKLRCDRELVGVGDSRWHVQAKCGAPTARDRRMENPEPGRFVTVDEWVYDRGPREFVRLLRFEDGKLVHIEVGDYGR
jgi:hypothetical protein